MTETEKSQHSEESVDIPVTVNTDGTGEEKQERDNTQKPETQEITLESYKRLQAEFANYRKRVQKEQERSHSFARGELIKAMLPVIDDFERMIDHHEDDEACSQEGIRLIYQNLKKILIEQGLQEIPSMGELFNPEVHEAVCVEDTEEKGDDRILEVWLKGYRFMDRVLRPAKVKVGRYNRMTGDSVS
jgi:molecular chaperone GrpE